MASTQTDRISKPTVNSSLAIKAACRVATTGADINSALTGGALGSGGGGLPTIDGVALAAGDRVLVKDQADQTTNGIWVATSTAWQRDVDSNSNTSFLRGMIVTVTDGTANAGLWFQLTSSNPVTIGSSSLTFAVTSNPTVSVAMSPVVGAATLAQARTAMGLATGATTTVGALATENIGQGLEDDGASNLRVKLDTTTGADAIARSASGIKVDASFMRGYLSGLTLSNDGVTPNTKVDIAAGLTVDDSNAAFLKSTGTLVVDFTTTGANGLDTGTIAASKWYHIWAIGKADGTVAGFANRDDLTALSPTLPTGYVYKRRLGSVRTDASSHILAFTQIGDWFLWKLLTLDANLVAESTTAASVTLTVPPSVNVQAKVGIFHNPTVSSSRFWAYSPSMTDAAATTDGHAVVSTPATAGTSNGLTTEIWTNTSSQIRVVSDVNTGTYSVSTIGWRDLLGK